MTATISFQAASDRLLELAARSGTRHVAGCEALLELLATSNAVDEVLRRELLRQPISIAGFGVLVLLDRQHNQPLGTSDLAAALSVSPKTISETLARLEIAKLITRVRRAKNRRHNTVELSAAGQRTITSVLQHLESKVHHLTRPLSTEQLSDLRQCCARLRPSDSHSLS